MSKLRGKRVALLEARMSNELAKLVRLNGGEPVCVPAVREEAVDSSEQVAALIDDLNEGRVEVIFFQTGVGAKALFKEAERLERLTVLLNALTRVTTVARGPKPTTVLKQNKVPISVSIREPYTTREILDAVDQLELAHKGVALLHYGERNTALAEALKARSARLHEITLYEWRMPEDVGPLEKLVRQVIEGCMDAVVFTSQIQVRHFLEIGASLKQKEELVHALNTRTTVAAVGPTCAATLQSFGVAPRIVPSPPKMGPLVAALAEHLATKTRKDS
jgi:uroporphyrinogen-III synthase